MEWWKHEAVLREYIGRMGWSVIGVLPDCRSAGFAYTVGLTPHGLPELLADGDPRRDDGIYPLLHSLARRQMDRGRFEPGDQIPTDDPDVSVEIGYPTRDTYGRARCARRMYSFQYRVRVLHAQLIHPDGTAQ